MASFFHVRSLKQSICLGNGLVTISTSIRKRVLAPHRRSCQPESFSTTSPPPLVFFNWEPSFTSQLKGHPLLYSVFKSLFLWLSLSPSGKVVNFLDPDGKSSSFSSKGVARVGLKP
ncbi:hypothetical protein CRG98_048497 [Punica granatum]|uniref:Uncharacterized protein n=1 Tax=Punica granatum TaxID=22663 RepID=A0A2I0HHM1_PUNGR|nr:hypothetical protein CRG98_048497 [Punica granatum]